MYSEEVYKKSSSVYSEPADEVSEQSSHIGSVIVSNPMEKLGNKKDESHISDNYTVLDEESITEKQGKISSTELSVELPTKQEKEDEDDISDEDEEKDYSDYEDDVTEKVQKTG